MADPINVSIPKNTWTLVASDVVTGLITIQEWQPTRYYKAHRMVGNPAPTGDQNESTSTTVRRYQIEITSLEPIDVYLYCLDQDGAVVVSL